MATCEKNPMAEYEEINYDLREVNVARTILVDILKGAWESIEDGKLYEAGEYLDAYYQLSNRYCGEEVLPLVIVNRLDRFENHLSRRIRDSRKIEDLTK